MFDLRRFSLDDMYRCSADLRSLGESSADHDEAAARIVGYLFDALRAPGNGERACALVRLFRCASLASLRAEGVAEAAGPNPSERWLSLAATRGVEPAWNDVARSERHRKMPLGPAGRNGNMPMVAALVAQLGVSDALLEGNQHGHADRVQSFDVFHVERARGSPFIPDQASFVEPYGVASVVGFGGVLPPADLFVVLLFSKVPVGRATAELFRGLAPSVGLALLASDRDGGALEARLRSYELLVRDHERMALDRNGQLARTADELAAALAERERLLASAEEARAAALAASHAKDDFLASLGHELRNPLSPILTGVELLKLRGAAAREVAIIERQAVHLARLVDDLLDVARIARGKLEVRKAPVEIASVVARAAEIATPALEQRKQRLSVSVPEGLLVSGDLGRLAQVTSNLLDNASKYSPPGSLVTLEAARRGDRVELRVRDEGVGIPREKLEAIFESFVQNRDGHTSAAGLGLGLTIVRTLVELHGGTVHAESAGPGAGSELVVDLPALGEPGHEAPTRAREAHGDGSGPSRRVLLVDDNTDATTTLKDALVEVGHEVLVANDGPSALAVAEAFGPDVALLDIGLPSMDGYELARRLRSLPGIGADVRFVALTGFGQEDDRRRSAEAGFVAHLVKPVPLAGLLDVVRR